MLHSDVDVVFLSDPAPALRAARCDHCLGSGQYPEALGSKWGTGTGCFGFAAHRAGQSATSELFRRVVALTEALGDDQVALNMALDEFGFGAAAAAATPRSVDGPGGFRGGLTTGAAVVLLDGVTFQCRNQP